MDIPKVIFRICKSLIVSCFVTGILMLLFSFFLWKMDLGGGVLKGMVIGMYILSSFMGGIYIGKKQKEKKFLWGMLSGSLYFLILVLFTVLSKDYTGSLGMEFVTACVICCFSGTLGGMVA